MKKLLISIISFVFLFALVLLISPSKVSAHCDALDGPVVKAARKALEKDNVNYILIWVKPEDEDKIRKALKKAREKRKRAKTKEEKDKADMEFFETLVRVHREGEGAKYEGIKPAGSVEPVIKIADKTVEKGKLDAFLHYIESPKNKAIVLHLFRIVQKNKGYKVDDVGRGRRFVNAYVTFIHAVEKAVKGIELREEELHDH